MKQSKLRRRRVIRYAILYFVLLIVFVALLVGPVAVRKTLGDNNFRSFWKTLAISHDFNKPQSGGMILMQPNFLSNQNTNASSVTGTAGDGYTWPSGYGPSSLSSSADQAATTL
jgi:1,3-beta-glucan synthase